MKRAVNRRSADSKREAGVLHTRPHYEVRAGQQDAANRSPDVDVIDISKLKEKVKKERR